VSAVANVVTRSSCVVVVSATGEEFTEKLSAEQATYQKVLNPTP
jgi:hypothetical protein